MNDSQTSFVADLTIALWHLTQDEEPTPCPVVAVYADAGRLRVTLADRLTVWPDAACPEDVDNGSPLLVVPVTDLLGEMPPAVSLPTIEAAVDVAATVSPVLWDEARWRFHVLSTMASTVSTLTPTQKPFGP